MKEITFELTSYCPHGCKYCSSEATQDWREAKILPFSIIWAELGIRRYDRIILSGGEPLAHPRFYDILVACQGRASDVVVYTNALRHIAYNAGVIDGVYVEAALTVPEETSKVRILRRVKQGREASRPEVTYSSNWDDHVCNEKCEHVVILPDGSRGRPCKKRP